MPGLSQIILSLMLIFLSLPADEMRSIRDTLTPDEQAYLLSHPVIRAHNESNWPPFNFNVNGHAKGFAVDLMNILAQKLGIKVHYVSGNSWSEFLNMLQTNALDVMINVSMTTERKQSMALTSPYLHAKNAIYTNVKKQAYYTLGALEGKRVALVKDFFIQKYITKHYPKIKQILVPDLPKALEILSFEKADAVVGKQVAVDYILRERLISSIMATDYIQASETISHLAIAADKKDGMLIQILEKAQKSLDPKMMEKLKHKWFGINALLNTQELLTPKEKAYLKSIKKLRICYRSNNVPIEFEGPTDPEGIAIDVMLTIGRRLDINLAFLPTDSQQDSVALLRGKHCDVISGAISVLPGTQQSLLSRPYLQYNMVIVTRKGEPIIEDFSHVFRQVYATWDGDPSLKGLQTQYPYLRMQKYQQVQDALEAVASAKANFAVVPQDMLEYTQQRGDYDGLYISAYAPLHGGISMAVSKRNPLLLGVINKLLQSVPMGAYRAISDKWIKGTVIKKTDYTVLFQMMALALVVIGGILLAYRRQSRLKHHIEELNNSLETRIAEALEKNKEQQSMMLHQNRLARMGEMIAMIAHQWRQPLNNLSLVNQILISKYKNGKLDDKVVDYFQYNSKEQITRMSETIDDFRNFYKIDKVKIEFCVSDVIKELIERTRIVYKHVGIVIEFYAEGCPHFFSYPNELGHAVQNIMANAQEAFEDQETQSKKITVRVFEDEDRIGISIEDNAGGIPEVIRNNIFDPYFSTKENKNGTGLGLHMANVIITEHMKSEIKVLHKDQGTQFMIHLKKGQT